MRSMLFVLALGLIAPSLASAQTVRPGWGRVSFVGSHPAMTFHVPGASASGSAWGGRSVVSWRHRTYRPVCTAPCARMMPLDTYRLALSLEDGPEIDVRGAFELRDGTTVYGRYVNNSGIRTFGGVLMALSALGTAALAITGFVMYGRQENVERALPFWLGSGATFVTMWVGLGAMCIWDHTEIRVVGADVAR